MDFDTFIRQKGLHREFIIIFTDAFYLGNKKYSNFEAIYFDINQLIISDLLELRFNNDNFNTDSKQQIERF